MFAQKLVRSVLAKMGYSIVKHEVIGDLYKTLKAYVRADSPIVLDVGAHYGESVTEYRALFPHARIYSFEPDPQSFNILLKNTAGLNGVQCIQQALSHSSGNADLFKNESSATNSLLPISHSASALWGEDVQTSNLKEQVSLTTLDRFCSTREISTVDVLKIDVQGAEMSVLKGATDMFGKSAINVVVCEILTSPTYSGQHVLWEYLQFAEYNNLVLVDILNQVRKKNRLLQIDAVFVRKELLSV